jgi:CheY-like chemotaxis protein
MSNPISIFSKPAGRAAASAAQLRILVVDDFEPMRKVTANQLRQFNIADTVTQADNGQAALRLMENQQFDMILSDWNMPVLDGLQFLQRVRADPRWSHLPFVMITAEAERERVQLAVEAGVSDMLLKPYTADRLLERVQRALRWKPVRPAASEPEPAPKPEAVAHADAAPPVPPSAPDAEPDAAPATAPLPGRPAKPRSAMPTVLVVDDTPDNLQLISQLFKDKYRVRLAHNGARAIAMCQSDNPPDLVLLDVMMPDMDGFQVAATLREHPASETIPIIFVTALTDAASRQRGMGLGAVDFVTKPIDPPMLQVKVENFMRYVQLHKNLQDDYDLMVSNARLREQVEQITRHDLKGPLAGILGLLHAMPDASPAERSEQLRMIEETTLHLLDMVNLSAELYKIETGRFALHQQPLDIATILGRVVALTGKAFAATGLDLVLQDPGPPQGEVAALGDATLCHSLFQNLVKNACEASPEWCRVDIELVYDTKLLVRITNRGAVPLALRERFWEKFATQGKAHGTGLGTYSARLLAEAQHGHVEMRTDDVQNRTSIEVWLPRAPLQPGD